MRDTLSFIIVDFAIFPSFFVWWIKSCSLTVQWGLFARNLVLSIALGVILCFGAKAMFCPCLPIFRAIARSVLISMAVFWAYYMISATLFIYVSTSKGDRVSALTFKILAWSGIRKGIERQ